MANVKRSQGAELVERVERWIGGYMIFPDPDFALLVALWSMGSWVFDHFSTWPYMAVTATTKGAGKTRCLELATMIGRNGLITTSITPPALLRLIKARNGQLTLGIDEAESTAKEGKSLVSEFLNSGYRKGQMIYRSKGDDVVAYPSYCPKIFALIGDPAGTVRDRSIVITLQRGNPARDYATEVAEGEAAELQGEIVRLFSTATSKPVAEPDGRMDGRAREIWASVFGLASWLGLDDSQRARLLRVAFDVEGQKTAPKRASISTESEDAAVDDRFSRRLLADLLSVFSDGDRNISTAQALGRLHGLPAAPWRTFKGAGLDEFGLSGLMRRFGVTPTSVRVKDDKGRAIAGTPKGYKRADVVAAMKVAGVNQ